MSFRDTYIKAFHIPADFDDTFVNIGLGSLLKENSKSFPKSYKSWTKRNSNLNSAFTALKKYAYRYIMYMSHHFLYVDFFYMIHIFNDVSVLHNLYDALIIKMLNICMIILLSLKYMLCTKFFLLDQCQMTGTLIQ